MSFWDLQGLKHLSLSSNNFSGSLPINLVQQLRNLLYLDLSYNRFSIDVTNTSSQASLFPDVIVLMLASCQLKTVPNFLAGQYRLVHLDLSVNQIQGKIPRWIWGLQNLLYLNLSCNLLDEIETPSPGITSTLRYLDLHKNRLHGQTLPLPPLAEYLDFSSNNFTLAIPPAIGMNLSVALFFSLSNNSFQGFIPRSICKAENLQMLDLSHNNLTGNIPDCLVMETLKVLILRDNIFNGSILNFPETCGLKTLDLSSNLLQGKFPKSLANCTILKVLDVGNNQIDDVFPCHLKSIANLRVLVLRSNKFHGGVGCPETNGTWKMLQIVDISSNDFGGTLPAQWVTSWEAMKANVDFSYIQCTFYSYSGFYYQDTVSLTIKGHLLELVKILTVFTSVDFSCNNFEGPLPDTLGGLKALHGLNLSNNAFSGPIPSSLGHLHQLESLDLSRNSLSGTIPTQLSDLNFLSFLNLTYNELVGCIPAIKQFSTFSASSFEGNARLCGPPLETNCSSSFGEKLGSCGIPLKKTCSIAANGMEETGCVPTQSDPDDGSNDDDSEKKWFYMGIPFGFAVGFWVICGPLAFKKSWRFAYYRFWDKLLFRHSHDNEEFHRGDKRGRPTETQEGTEDLAGAGTTRDDLVMVGKM